jgi:hypothetical protein
MASDKQIQANRRNARRSTGPRTAAGKSIASRNAFRHGLSVSQAKDETTLAEILELADQVAGEDADQARFDAAIEYATAYFEIGLIQNVRNQMLGQLNLAAATPKELWRLFGIDRYENRARTKRRRAATKIDSSAAPQAFDRLIN